MYHLTDSFRATLNLIVRAFVIVLVLSAPVLAVPSMGASDVNVIEAPSPPKSGLGFVLLVSLQRA